MNEKTQILNVTYGTFSCRLEGFDNSVETMKLVVGYFHELAGHDRFMDMTPQAPDLDTLAQLTGAQSDGEVDAEVEDGTLSLRLRATPDEAEEGLSLLMTPPVVTEDDPDQNVFRTDEDDTVAPAEDTAEEDTAENDQPEAQAEDTAEEDTAENDQPGAPAADEYLPDESVAAKLQRIRAVVGRGHVTETSDTFSEDIGDEDQIAPRGGVNPLAQRLAELAKRNSELAAIEAGIKPAPLNDADETAHDDDDNDDAWTAEDTAEIEARDEEEYLEDLAALDGATPVDFDGDDAATVDEPEDDERAEDGPLVLTHPDSAFDEADDLEDDTDELDDEDLHLANLVDDDDLNLHEEVAEVERQIEDRNKRHELSRTADAAISRILLQTDAQLNQPELRRQQDAFAQLKAAVAATEAARQLGDDGGPKRRPSEVYRRDLGEFESEEEMDDALASHFDAEDINADEAPDATLEPAQESQKPAATLRLVASQRTSEPVRPMDAASMRLRQIAANAETATTRTIGFADFADEHGVSDLDEMIEAAAAYIAFISKADDFSRPQVMKVVQTTTTEEISREDGLRCFGRLLRQNRIIKLDNGRFQVAPNTRFRPDDQVARG